MSRTSGAAAAQPWWIHTDEQFQVDVSQPAGDYSNHYVLGLISCFLELECCAAKEIPSNIHILCQDDTKTERGRDAGSKCDDQDHPGRHASSLHRL